MNRSHQVSVAFIAFCALFLAGKATAFAGKAPLNAAADVEEQSSGEALLLEVSDAIGPATANYIVEGIDRAEEEGFSLVVLKLDTPGGLDTAMRDIIKRILNSKVPVVTWVAPEGARAASAGTYILYASHIAAMAPATNLGAATPISIGGNTPAPEKPDNPGADESAADDGGKDSPAAANRPSAAEQKAVNDAVAYIRSLAEERGRNADWAERAVREGASLSSNSALEQNVIDVVARNLPELLKAIDGKTVNTVSGTTEIASSGLTIVTEEPDWRTELLSIITNPSIAYMLMLVGIYGLLFEGYNPGAIVPGVVGAICILLALYAFQLLPVNYAGLGLIVLGVILMTAEVFAPSFGALGLGGIIAFVFGSVILIDSDVPGFGIPLPLILGASVIGGLSVLGIVWFAVSSKNRRIVSGKEEMIGSMATALRDFQGKGLVHTHGENWSAFSEQAVAKGQVVRIKALEGLTVHIEPVEDSTLQQQDGGNEEENA